ncbi:MAG: hypothetical protein P8X63_15145, partial [Desulfuromonadaceae bacterium]
APACSIEFYQKHYEKRLKTKAGAKSKLPILDIYNLNEKLELDDNVVSAYQKSLLYLVSRALEREIDKPLLGMQLHTKRLSAPGLTINYSDGKKKGNKDVTTSTSHGGFDNDVTTMNAIMQRILGKEPAAPFTKEEMKGY